MRRLLTGVISALALVLLGTSTAFAQHTIKQQSGLAEETLSTTTVATQCTLTSATSSITALEASGDAAGPYPGTFTETGQVISNGTQITASATFQILSGSTVINGTKYTAEPQPGGLCTPGPGLSFFSFNEMDYDAVIDQGKRSPWKVCDTGITDVSLKQPAGQFNFFQEIFLQSTSTIRCKR